VGVAAGFCMYDVIVNKFTFAISSPDEFLYYFASGIGAKYCDKRVRLSVRVCLSVRSHI